MTEPTVPAWDSDGAVRAIPVDRVRREGLKHMAVSVVVSTGRDVLVLRGPDGRWSLPVILPAWSEHYAIAAARLLRDGLGLTGIPLRKGPLADYRAARDEPAEQAAVQVFRAGLDARPALTPDPVLATALRWAPRDALAIDVAADPAAFSPWLRALLATHPEQLSGALMGAQDEAAP